MVKDAEAHAAEDKKRRDVIEQRNRLDNMVYQVQKESKDWVEKLEPGLKSRLDAAIQSAQSALRSGNADEISKHSTSSSRHIQRRARHCTPRVGRPVRTHRGRRRSAGGGDGQPGAEAKRMTRSWMLITKSWTTINRRSHKRGDGCR